MSGRAKVIGPPIDDAGVLSPPALAFVADLHDRFAVRLEHLLAERQRRHDMVAVGEPLDFLPETAAIRTGDWQVAIARADLANHRLVDLSDTLSPTWSNLTAALLGGPDGAIVVRPRGFHLPEKHLTIDGRTSVATLVDAGVALFHHTGDGLVLSLPMLESHLEARLWADLLTFAEIVLGRPVGSTGVTVPIDTVWAAFEADELVYELRERVVGLAPAWSGYLFSLVKAFRGAGTEYVLPERAVLDESAPFLRACAGLLATTAHRRGLGGSAPNVTVTGKDLLDIRSVPLTVTDEGLRSTIEVALAYLVNWLAGRGTVSVGDEVVDAPTAELCRSQLWQWRRNRVSLEGGRRITGHLVVTELDEATERLADVWADRPGGRELLAGARNLLYDSSTALRFTDFITVPAYELMP